MTIAELIKELQKYDPNTLVGGSGHFGEYLPVEYINYVSRENQGRYVFENKKDESDFFFQQMTAMGDIYRGKTPKQSDIKYKTEPLPPFVNISIQWAGPEPD